MKPFFRLNEKNKDRDVVEYSTDFKFFLENQIIHWKSGSKHSFTSGLESKTFKVIKSYQRDGLLDKENIMFYCREIHKEILQGKHGAGKLVD